jgi:hypothetical protein
MEKTMKTLALISSAFVLSVGLVLLVALEAIGIWTALAAGVMAAIVLAIAFVALQDPPKKTEGMTLAALEEFLEAEQREIASYRERLLKALKTFGLDEEYSFVAESPDEPYVAYFSVRRGGIRIARDLGPVNDRGVRALQLPNGAIVRRNERNFKRLGSESGYIPQPA